jgi:hypothetical protein
MGRGSGEAFDTGVVPDLRRLPVRSLGRVAHIGTMQAGDKSASFGGSWEGHGLSVSLDPEAWEAIAKLGGGPWWELRSFAGRFIEAHDLGAAQREVIAEWGREQGLVESITAYRSTHHDEEGEEYFVLHETKEDAEVESDWDGEEDSAASPVAEDMTLKPTALLEEKLGMRSHLNCFDHLLVVYGDEMTGYDGVWWEDDYGHLSAPRGVIFPGRVEGWQARQISPGEWD